MTLSNIEGLGRKPRPEQHDQRSLLMSGDHTPESGLHRIPVGDAPNALPLDDPEAWTSGPEDLDVPPSGACQIRFAAGEDPDAIIERVVAALLPGLTATMAADPDSGGVVVVQGAFTGPEERLDTLFAQIDGTD